MSTPRLNGDADQLTQPVASMATTNPCKNLELPDTASCLVSSGRELRAARIWNPSCRAMLCLLRWESEPSAVP